MAEEYKHFIGGKQVEGTSGRFGDVYCLPGRFAILLNGPFGGRPRTFYVTKRKLRVVSELAQLYLMPPDGDAFDLVIGVNRSSERLRHAEE